MTETNALTTGSHLAVFCCGVLMVYQGQYILEKATEAEDIQRKGVVWVR